MRRIGKRITFIVGIAVITAMTLLTESGYHRLIDYGGYSAAPARAVEAAAPAREREVELIGLPVGISLGSDGVIIADITEVMTESGSSAPAKTAGLSKGDTIVSIDSVQVDSANTLMKLIEQCDGRELSLKVRSKSGEVKELSLTPVFSSVDNCYRAGVWVRENATGIGILTFIEPSIGAFGAVGHSICEDDTQSSSRTEGVMTDVILSDVKKGAKGSPGELIGYLGERQLGSLLYNGDGGVYGRLKAQSMGGVIYKTADRHKIREGKAQLMTTLPGENSTKLFDIVIERICADDGNPTRNMIIRVTDSRLLEQTGGIVQGMSGSPIIQDGRFVAAATHVFVNDPTRGYAIFADKMLDIVDKCTRSTLDDVA